MIIDDYAKLKKYAEQAEGVIPKEEYVDTVAGYWDYIESLMSESSEEDRNALIEKMISDVDSSCSVCFRLFLLSVLLYMDMDGKWSSKMYQIINSYSLNIDVISFFVQQMLAFDFKYPGIINRDVLEEIYAGMVAYWRDTVKKANRSTDRTDNRVVIISTQVAGLRHAPTKTLFERVEVLGAELGMEVLVIHSRESLTQKEEFPFYRCQKGIVIDDYNGLKNIALPSGYTFKMYQPENAMPNAAEMVEAVNLIMTYAPSEVIVLGDHCVLGDVIADYYPTMNMPFGFSALYPKDNQYSVVFRKLTEADYAMIDAWGIKREKYIEGVFTFRFIPQSSKCTRKDLGIPENAFTFVAIGNRLGADITDEFVRMLMQIKDDNWFIVFAGSPEGFDYDKLCEKHPEILNHSGFLGYVEDVLALLECCDLYINPPRLGGGFSVAEAFSKGKPGVSLNYGDVAAAAGREFCVETLEEMKETIERYMNDNRFYEDMSQKAIARAAVLQDGKSALADILSEFRRRYSEESKQ